MISDPAGEHDHQVKLMSVTQKNQNHFWSLLYITWIIWEKGFVNHTKIKRVKSAIFSSSGLIILSLWCAARSCMSGEQCRWAHICRRCCRRHSYWSPRSYSSDPRSSAVISSSGSPRVSERRCARSSPAAARSRSLHSLPLLRFVMLQQLLNIIRPQLLSLSVRVIIDGAGPRATLWRRA